MTSWFSRSKNTNGQEGVGVIGSFFSNVANKIITTLAEEKDRFLNEKEDDSAVKPNAIPLWLAIQASDSRITEEARNAIIGLTKSKRNFLNAPPDEAEALTALNADPKLNLARFYLVPTYIKEEDFWRNWFYRVQIILSAYGLEMPSVSASNATHSTTLSAEEALTKNIEKELGELGIHTAEESNPEAWEEELKRELSSLDPTKEGPDSLLSQNWEEELMLELGISKNSPESNALSTPTPSPSTTAILASPLDSTAPAGPSEEIKEHASAEIPASPPTQLETEETADTIIIAAVTPETLETSVVTASQSTSLPLPIPEEVPATETNTTQSTQEEEAKETEPFPQ